MRRYLKGDNLEQITRSISGYSDLPGDPALQPATHYVCPRCGYPWYREDNDPIPQCPHDFIPLVPAQS
jgi:rubrerythrin